MRCNFITNKVTFKLGQRSRCGEASAVSLHCLPNLALLSLISQTIVDYDERIVFRTIYDVTVSLSFLTSHSCPHPAGGAPRAPEQVRCSPTSKCRHLAGDLVTFNPHPTKQETENGVC